ncbi:hypothetical protein ZEAMMB73_Zm00001d049953 [Zea mays]|uniref:Uncharacterized protein n=1 Tax=Zea mays TaxID=4577 RepID=K7UD55_MAIZE|nr:hypothetical protein ZEAMMB73_Zm00001d049953 [Zea mays]
MAEDIWTLKLQFEGDPPGQKMVQREMDKDEICFFNLIELIEEYGYTSVDYVYYKRRDGLVAIQWDSDVMQMLEENESKRKVSLFVTKQRMATIAPTKFNEEPTNSAENKNKGKRGTKEKQRLNVIQIKEQYYNEVDQHHDNTIQQTQGDGNNVIKRKGTVLTHVWDLPKDKRILVKCNQLGQPIGKEGGLLGQFLGTIARNGGYCPIDVNDWRKIKKDSAETILQCIQTKFLYPRSCEKWILKSIGRDWRKYKSILKKKLFSPKKKRSYLYKLCPDDIDEDQWKSLVKYWKSSEGKALSEKNKLSCQMKKTTHSGGTKSFARWSEDMVQLENLIEKQPELAQNCEGRVAWEGDALHQVLGEEKSGQVHGMGLLPIPKQVYGRTTRQFKDINIATIEGSSADVDTHLLEEIQQLKEHARKQDKVIDELINKKRHNENEEVIKELTAHGDFQTGHANLQNHVVHSNRKNIRTCVSEYSDNVDPIMSNKKRQGDANRKQLSHQAEEPLSPQCSSIGFGQKENQQGVLKENRIMAQKIAQDKAMGQNNSKFTQPRPIKDGTTVILKTASRPNKAIVAYATILSSSPKESVGGVEIGKQFYKVRINHPVLQDEPLVRPMPGYDKIGDAHAKGVAIAWPWLCVQMING